MYYSKKSIVNATGLTKINVEKYSVTDLLNNKFFIFRRTFIELIDNYFQCSEEELEIRLKSSGWI